MHFLQAWLALKVPLNGTPNTKQKIHKCKVKPKGEDIIKISNLGKDDSQIWPHVFGMLSHLEPLILIMPPPLGLALSIIKHEVNILHM